MGVPAVVWLGFAAFIGLGMPEATLGVTWPSIRADFARPLGSLGILLGALTAGYLPSSLLSGRVVARLGPGRMLAAASATYVAALLLYVLGPGFGFLVVGSFLAGIASGAIDPGINAHFAVHHGTRAMNLLHASFGIGATTGPIIATVALDLGDSWRIPYLVYLLVQAGLFVGFVATRDDWDLGPSRASDAGRERSGGPDIDLHGLASPVVLLSIASFFVYTGLEVGSGVLAYTLLQESRGLSDGAAGLWAASFWGGVTIGRLLLGVAGRRLDAETVMRASIAGAVIAAAWVWTDPAGAGAAGYPALGVALAGVFPSLVLLTPRRVGPARTPTVVGVQFSLAALGGAAVPALIGIAAEDDLARIGVAMVGLAVLLAGLDLLLRRISRPDAGRLAGGR